MEDDDMLADRLDRETAGDLPGLFRVLFISVKSCFRKRESESQAGFLSEVPKPPAPDADSPADAIRSLTAQVADMKSETDQLRRENRSLLQQHNAIAAQVSNQVKEEVRRETLGERDSAIVQLKRFQDIAEALSLSEKTVSTHKTRLMRKLSVKNKADLIRYAVEHDLTCSDHLGKTTADKHKLAGRILERFPSRCTDSCQEGRT